MDPVTAIGLIASVGQITEGTVKLAIKLTHYFHDVKNAPARSQELRSELRTLASILSLIQETLQIDSRALRTLEYSIDEFQELLAELSIRISPERTEGFNKLKWPFTAPENEKILAKIERYKSTFNIALTLNLNHIGCHHHHPATAAIPAPTSSPCRLEVQEKERPLSSNSAIELLPSGESIVNANIQASSEVPLRPQHPSTLPPILQEPLPSATVKSLSTPSNDLKRAPSSSNAPSRLPPSLRTKTAPKLPLPISKLMYSHSTNHQLVKLLGPKLKRREAIELTSISPTGRTIAILTSHKFFIFVLSPTNTLSLSCEGEFESKKLYKYSSGAGPLAAQTPKLDKFKVSHFSYVAVTDTYLAVGADRKILIFILEGDKAGRWICWEENEHAVLEKLQFSLDGKQLLAFMRVGDYQKVCVYSTAAFPLSAGGTEKIVRMSCSEEVEWEWDREHSPSDIVFSKCGTMVGICTTHCSNLTAEIRILKRIKSRWQVWGTRKVQVMAYDRRGVGFTGISFFNNDQFVVLSVNSSYTKTTDCYRIVASSDGVHCTLRRAEQIVAGNHEPTNLAVTVSHQHNAIALLNTKGALEIKMPDEPTPVHVIRKSGFGHMHASDVSLSFTDTGERLIYLDRHGNLEIHEFLSLSLPSTPTVGEMKLDGFCLTIF